MKKRLLAVLLSGTMLMQIFGSAVFASSDIPAGNEEPTVSGSADEELTGNDVDTSIFDDSLGNFLRQEDEFLSLEDDSPAVLAENEDDLIWMDLGSEDLTEEEAFDLSENAGEETDEAEPEEEKPDAAADGEKADDVKAEEADSGKKEEKPQTDAAVPEEVQENAVSDIETVYPEVPVYYAEDLEDAISNAESLQHEAFFEIDPTDGSVVEGDILFEELSDGEEFSEVVEDAETKEEKIQKIEETLEESGLYSVKETQGGTLEVTSIFASGRLILEADYQEMIQSYGAVNAMYYDGSYEFTYESEEAAKNAYDLLVAEYGPEAVIRDLPMKTQAAKGWGTSHMNMDVRMRMSDANYTVKVGVVDTGIYRYHDVFDYTTVTDGYNIADDNYSYTDTNGHGTATAGIIAESTGSNVQIIPVKVTIGSTGSAYSNDIYKGALYAAKKGAKVVNISMGGEGSKAEYDYFCGKYAKINSCVVTSSGNDYINIDYHYCVPAMYPSTIAVGAIDSSRNVMFGYNSNTGNYYGSNYGKSLDYVAPGVDVACAVTQTYSDWAYMSGTSMASPYVAAAVALLYSDNKNLTVAEVRKVLKEMSIDLGAEGKDEDYGWGLPKFSSGTRNIRKAKINNISNRVYSGKLIKPCPRVTYDGVKLTRGVDYTLNWSNNKLVGKGIVVVVGKGRYTGVARKAFNIILKGKYTIQSAVNKKYVLDVAGGSKKNNANVRLYKSNGSAAQKYTITKVGNYYKIINCKSKKAVEVAGGKAKNGRNVQQYKWNKSKAQLWKVKMYGGGKIMFVSAVNGKFCLDLSGAKAKNGANVQLYKRNNSKAQRWYVKRAK